MITTGLSKSVALGGWRIGYARTPDGAWGRTVRAGLTGVASEVWSSLSAPMQAVAAHVLADPADVLARIDASRRLHARVAAAVHAEFVAAGAIVRPPQAAFYVYPDFGPLRGDLLRRGITTGTQLATALLEEHDIATLPGRAFGDEDDALTLRVATSLLYGSSTEQRLEALGSEAPETLPWIAESLDFLRRGLARLTGEFDAAPASGTPVAR